MPKQYSPAELSAYVELTAVECGVAPPVVCLVRVFVSVWVAPVGPQVAAVDEPAVKHSKSVTVPVGADAVAVPTTVTVSWTMFPVPSARVPTTVGVVVIGGVAGVTEKHSTFRPVVGAAVVAVVLSLSGLYVPLPP